jgi:hypothetical protein
MSVLLVQFMCAAARYTYDGMSEKDRDSATDLYICCYWIPENWL